MDARGAPAAVGVLGADGERTEFSPSVKNKFMHFYVYFRAEFDFRIYFCLFFLVFVLSYTPYTPV